jgi:calcineurin-like phosphoesterase family protein
MDNFKDSIKDGDTVYFLGDLTLKRGDRFKEYFYNLLSSIPAEKIFLYGNHDKMKPHDYEEMGFDAVTKKDIDLNIGGYSFLLSHRPTSVNNSDIINIHGHVHDKWKTNYRDGSKTLLINVSIEVWDYKPVSLEDTLVAIEAATFINQAGDTNHVTSCQLS